MTTTNLNPSLAPEHKPRTRKYAARCVGNEVSDAPEKLKEAIGKAASENVPFWTIKYERLDAQWPDGNPVTAEFGTFLTDKEGNILDKTMAPFVMAQAFQGLGIIAYPDDSQYDAGKIVGNVFFIEEVEKPYSKPNRRGYKPTMPVPLAVLGPGYTLPADVKIQVFTPKSADDVSVTPTGIPVSTEISDNAEALATLKAAIAGADRDAQLDILADLQKQNPIFKGATYKGQVLFQLAVDGTLGEAVGA